MGTFCIAPLQSNRLKLDFSIYLLLIYKSGIRIDNGNYPSMAMQLQMNRRSFIDKRSVHIVHPYGCVWSNTSPDCRTLFWNSSGGHELRCSSSRCRPLLTKDLDRMSTTAGRILPLGSYSYLLGSWKLYGTLQSCSWHQ